MPGYISEARYENAAEGNFIEIVVPRGTDTSGYTLSDYNSDGSLHTTFSLGAVDVTLAGNDGYVIDSSHPGWFDLGSTQAIALVDDSGTVLQFIGFNSAVTATEGHPPMARPARRWATSPRVKNPSRPATAALPTMLRSPPTPEPSPATGPAR